MMSMNKAALFVMSLSNSISRVIMFTEGLKRDKHIMGKYYHDDEVSAKQYNHDASDEQTPDEFIDITKTPGSRIIDPDVLYPLAYAFREELVTKKPHWEPRDWQGHCHDWLKDNVGGKVCPSGNKISRNFGKV